MTAAADVVRGEVVRVPASTLRKYALCRAFRHPWDDPQPATFNPSAPVWKYKVEQHCPRCGTWVEMALDAWGDVQVRNYHHPPGYSYAEDDTPSIAAFRLFALTGDADALAGETVQERRERRARERAEKDAADAADDRRTA